MLQLLPFVRCFEWVSLPFWAKRGCFGAQNAQFWECTSRLAPPPPTARGKTRSSPRTPSAGASTRTLPDRVQETGAANVQVATPPPPPGPTNGSRKGQAWLSRVTRRASQPPPARPPYTLTRARPHTHRHGGISLPRVPPRGTGAVSSPVGLVTGQPGVVRPNHVAQGRMRAVGLAVRGRPSSNATQPNPPTAPGRHQ